MFYAASFAAAQPTYSRDVSRIMQAKCQQCHREGDIAPFALSNFEQTQSYAEDIRRVVDQKTMPPWKPVPGHGDFRDSFALSDDERRTIIEWVDAGAPEGDPADLPAAPEPKGEWSLGDPDMVLQLPEPYSPARGRDVYRCFVLPLNLEEGKHVTAVDYIPGDRRMVHHIILFLDESGEAEKLDAKDEEQGYECVGGPGTPLVSFSGGSLLPTITGILGGWTPGTRAAHLPQGIGLPVGKKAKLVMQVHYYTRGRVTGDQTKVGLYFAKDRIDRQLIFLPLVPFDMRTGKVDLVIPANNERYTREVQFDIPFLFGGFNVINIYPHMHLLGREVKAEVVTPQGQSKSLIFINDWDFNWQGPYTFKDPVSVPAGSTLKASCTYNNSETNPKNPSNPVKTVRWGEGTEDEMCIVLLGVTSNLLPKPFPLHLLR